MAMLRLALARVTREAVQGALRRWQGGARHALEGQSDKARENLDASSQSLERMGVAQTRAHALSESEAAALRALRGRAP